MSRSGGRDDAALVPLRVPARRWDTPLWPPSLPGRGSRVNLHRGRLLETAIYWYIALYILWACVPRKPCMRERLHAASAFYVRARLPDCFLFVCVCVIEWILKK